MVNERKGTIIKDSDAKTVATRKGSGGSKANLKVRGGSGSTTGHSTSKKN